MGVGRSTSKTIEASRRRAVKALFAFFDASIERQLKKKTKRPIRPRRVAAIRASLSEEIIKSLSKQLRRIEVDYGKPYRDWTLTEHSKAARLIELFYSRARAELVRGPGRPWHRPVSKGLINSHIIPPTKRESAKQRAIEQKRLQEELFLHVDAFKAGRFAMGRYERLTDPREARTRLDRELSSGRITWDMIDGDPDAKDAEAVRDFVDRYDLPRSIQERHKKALSRRRLSPARRRR